MTEAMQNWMDSLGLKYCEDCAFFRARGTFEAPGLYQASKFHDCCANPRVALVMCGPVRRRPMVSCHDARRAGGVCGPTAAFHEEPLVVALLGGEE